MYNFIWNLIINVLCYLSQVELVAIDQNFDVSSPVTLHIAVQQSNTNGPRLVESNPLILWEGSFAAITTEHLRYVTIAIKHQRTTARRE